MPIHSISISICVAVSLLYLQTAANPQTLPAASPACHRAWSCRATWSTWWTGPPPPRRADPGPGRDEQVKMDQLWESRAELCKSQFGSISSDKDLVWWTSVRIGKSMEASLAWVGLEIDFLSSNTLKAFDASMHTVGTMNVYVFWILVF